MIEVNLYNEDLVETMKRIKNGAVDLLLQDTPFGVTQNKWDVAPDLEKLWPEWARIGKSNAAFIFFATQPFASELINSNKKMFKYDWVWEKSRPSGFLNANRMPLRSHEHILLFYNQLPVFNPQKVKGKPNHISDGRMSKKNKNNNYGEFGVMQRILTDDKFPKSVIYFDQQDPTTLLHPTQKPIDLIRYLIKTYSNEGDLVFDGYSGSGTTAAACIMEERNFVGSELNKEYFDLADNRIKNLLAAPTLFNQGENPERSVATGFNQGTNDGKIKKPKWM